MNGESQRGPLFAAQTLITSGHISKLLVSIQNLQQCSHDWTSRRSELLIMSIDHTQDSVTELVYSTTCNNHLLKFRRLKISEYEIKRKELYKTVVIDPYFTSKAYT